MDDKINNKIYIVYTHENTALAMSLQFTTEKHEVTTIYKEKFIENTHIILSSLVQQFLNLK